MSSVLKLEKNVNDFITRRHPFGCFFTTRFVFDMMKRNYIKINRLLNKTNKQRIGT